MKNKEDFKKKARAQIEERYQSPLIDRMRQNGFKLEVPPLSFYLAREFGFCYGVGIAIDRAFETRLKYPDRRIFLTNEIIHNPRVNRELREVGIDFLNTSEKVRDLKPEDVILLPAFGVSVVQLEEFRKLGSILVDTTCGSVMAVWKRVATYAKNGFTSVIHGKFNHEETEATCSQVLLYGGHYLVIKDIKEAEIIADFIETGKNETKVRDTFHQAMSHGFDLKKHLNKIGWANQTTMLSSESLQIAERLRRAMANRNGEEKLDDHFMQFETICRATQDRQDAVTELLQEKEIDLALVVGGFNSSNTANLLKIAEDKVRAFHISEADDLISLEEVRAKKFNQSDPEIMKNWLPEPCQNIAVTAGASTPNRVIEDVIRKFVTLKGLKIDS